MNLQEKGSMEFLQQSFSVTFEYKVFFTTHLFDPKNTLLQEFLRVEKKSETPPRILIALDENVARCHPYLIDAIRSYFSPHPSLHLVDEILVLPGGEAAKNNETLFQTILSAIHIHGIDRHSYVVGIGGGSLLDLVGYAAAVSHRGVRHVRIPTTVLAQNDSGVGVKNGINYFTKKNFLGTFAPPVAVFNDSHFLTTLSDADWRAGISEAIKVALIKDVSFFEWLKATAETLVSRDMAAMQYLIKRCAELHMEHIRSGDPFETGSSRPLDFGHWSAHKLEQLTNFTIRHGEAVAIGMALDCTYSHLSGRLSEEAWRSILQLIQAFGFAITHPLLNTGDNGAVLDGLNEFREHLGGKLTIMLLNAIGKGEEVHEMDEALIRQAMALLQTEH